MASYTWTTSASGDWNTATDWTPNLVPTDLTGDYTIDAPTSTAGGYTVTIAAGETVTLDSLTMNGVNNLAGSNTAAYKAAALQLDGTLAFAPGSAGMLGGSLQTYIYVDYGDNAEIINGGTLNGFIQVDGNLLLTGTNGVYITNDLQALAGTVTIDTKSIAEMTGNTLFDGIFEAKGPGAVIKLGGSLENLIVNIATIEGPPTIADGWTELTFNDPTAQILEWNGAAYVSVETTLTEIAARGTVDVLDGRNYTTTNTLAIEAGGLFNLQAGTVSTDGLDINAGGMVQGFATILGGVVNNGTLNAAGGTLDVVGNLTGTGVVTFDTAGTVAPFGATLEVQAVSTGQTIVMNGDDTLLLTAPGSFLGSIDISNGDSIVLQGQTVTSAVNNNGTLVLSNGTTTLASLKLAGTGAGNTFTTSGSIVTDGTVAASGKFTIADTTNNTTNTLSGQAYTGPVAGLTSQFILPTTDQVTVTAQQPDVFIQVGMQGQTNPLTAGINVSAANGNNVLDSYANSSFLTDGSGTDQNFIDARGGTQNSWSTIVNFHSGDNVTVWGVTPQDFTLHFIGDTYGAAGATGLTGVYVPNAGGPEYAFTLAGYTTADATDGKLAVTYDTIGGTPYASIHAT